MSKSPEPYVALNPDLFADKIWSLRDLRKLCKKVRVSDTGSRSKIVERLKSWHLEQRDGGSGPRMDFTMVSVAVSCHGASSPKQMTLDQDRDLISHSSTEKANERPASLGRLLSPLRVKNSLLQGTPTSILRKRSCYSERSPGSCSESSRFRDYHSSAVSSSRRRRRLMFSPYNGVQLIPSRLEYRTDVEQADV